MTASKKYQLIKTSLTYQTKQFFDHSTLHGVRYIAEEGRPFCERFLWFCCTSVGAVVTLIIIVSLWEKFQTNPTITGLDTDFHNWDVEFPGVTICQDYPVNETLVDLLIERNYPNYPDNETLKEYLIAIGSLNYDNWGEKLKKFRKDKTLPQENLKVIALQIVNRCEDLIESCEWKDDLMDCCSRFFPVFTERGFCYTFNSIHHEKNWPWGLKKAPKFKQEFIFETDVKWAMTFNITEIRSSDRVNKVDVHIHDSEETPGIDTEPQHEWDQRVIKIAFAAKHTYTTEDAKQLSIKQRRCVFSDEIELLTSKVYTFGGCMRECRMKKAFELCKCIPFFYAELEKYPYCDLRGLDCLINATDILTGKDICPCELGCKNTIYEVDKLTEDASATDESTKGPPPPLEVSFVSWPMIRYKREVLFGWVDLLVAFGGIAGLFLGFSLLSGVEILYYFTMRSCCMFLRDKKMLEQLKQEYEREDRPPLDLSLVPTFLKKDENKKSSEGITTVHPFNYHKNNAFSIMH